MSELDAIRLDLTAEQNALERIVIGIDDEAWRTPTASPGWDVRDQIGHLTFFDGTAALAISDPDAFAEGVSALIEAARTVGVDEYTIGAARRLPPAEVLELWRMNRSRLDTASQSLSEQARVAWYGPSMGAMSFLTARLMEVWAHGQDIVDALGADRPASDRLRHIARLGFNTRNWSYIVKGLDAPPSPIRVELSAPNGDRWTYGPSDAKDTVEGSAEDFCLVVTQRRHVDDTDLQCAGAGREWMLIAQAFAGGPTNGPAPRGGYGARRV